MHAEARSWFSKHFNKQVHRNIKGHIKLPHQDNQRRDHQNYQHFQT